MTKYICVLGFSQTFRPQATIDHLWHESNKEDTGKEQYFLKEQS